MVVSLSLMQKLKTHAKKKRKKKKTSSLETSLNHIEKTTKISPKSNTKRPKTQISIQLFNHRNRGTTQASKPNLIWPKINKSKTPIHSSTRINQKNQMKSQ
jgi:hypothetical protein